MNQHYYYYYFSKQLQNLRFQPIFNPLQYQQEEDQDQVIFFQDLNHIQGKRPNFTVFITVVRVLWTVFITKKILCSILQGPSQGVKENLNFKVGKEKEKFRYLFELNWVIFHIFKESFLLFRIIFIPFSSLFIVIAIRIAVISSKGANSFLWKKDFIPNFTLIGQRVYTNPKQTMYAAKGFALLVKQPVVSIIIIVFAIITINFKFLKQFFSWFNLF